MLSLREVEKNLENRGVMPKAAPSLKKTQQALVRLQKVSGKKHDPQQTLLVAGTNGKGSIAFTLEALLTQAGERVGLYTSPHLVSITERIRGLQNEISEAAFIQSFEKIQTLTTDLNLSHFEMLTVMAYDAFFCEEVFGPLSKVIFEVGVGGLWDATNAIEHDWGAIGTISYDHQDLLGNTLVKIAVNKLGIATKKDTVCVHTPFEDPDVRELAKQHALRHAIQFIPARPFEWEVQYQTKTNEPSFWLKSPWVKSPTLLNLPGVRAAENSMTALTLFEAMGYDPSLHLEALKKVQLQGRMQKIRTYEPKRVYVSGDHNIQGMQSLVQLLQFYPADQVFFCLGLGLKKDLETLRPLCELPNSFFLFTQTPFQGRGENDLKNWMHEQGFSQKVLGFQEEPTLAFEELLKQVGEKDLLVVTGSLYLVGFLLSQLKPLQNFKL